MRLHYYLNTSDQEIMLFQSALGAETFKLEGWQAFRSADGIEFPVCEGDTPTSSFKKKHMRVYSSDGTSKTWLWSVAQWNRTEINNLLIVCESDNFADYSTIDGLYNTDHPVSIIASTTSISAYSVEEPD